MISCSSQRLPSGSANEAKLRYDCAAGRGPARVPRAHAAPVPDLADVRAVADQVVAGGLDVVDDQVHVLHRARRHRRQPHPELDRGRRARRGELHDPVVLVDREVGVEPPPEALVERLGAIDVGHRQHRDLVAHRDAGTPAPASRRRCSSACCSSRPPWGRVGGSVAVCAHRSRPWSHRSRPGTDRDAPARPGPAARPWCSAKPGAAQDSTSTTRHARIAPGAWRVVRHARPHRLRETI